MNLKSLLKLKQMELKTRHKAEREHLEICKLPLYMSHQIRLQWTLS